MGALDREGLRQQLRHFTDVDRRLVLERVVDYLADEDVRRMLEGMVRFDERVGEHPSRSLLDRVRAHVAATRSGVYRGKYTLRNAHGQREPAETAMWESLTAHLFDLVRERASKTSDDELLTCATALIELVDEVDQRAEDLVVFEDRCAREWFAREQEDLRLWMGVHEEKDQAG
jgi:hypothetical protein